MNVRSCCRACGPLPAFAPGTAAEILAGRLTISPWPAVRIDPPRRRRRLVAGPVPSLDLVQTYQSGSWIGALIGRYLDGGPGADAYWAWARALLLSWLRDVPIQARAP